MTGVRLADGRELVVKVRGGVERARACVAGQAALQADGFACPAPLTSVGVVNVSPCTQRSTSRDDGIPSRRPWMARRAGDDVLIVHDLDSLVTRPEPAVAGAAAATFASGEQPTLAPLEVSARFFGTYQRAAGRVFDRDELEVAWAAGLWLAAHNARMELLYGKPLVVTSRLAEEAPERLRRAGA